MVDAVLAELPPLISESDMHVSQMALSFLSTLAVTHPSSLGQLSAGSILTQLIALVRSPLLQGGALAAMLDFYQVGGASPKQPCLKATLPPSLTHSRHPPHSALSLSLSRHWCPPTLLVWATWTC